MGARELQSTLSSRTMRGCCKTFSDSTTPSLRSCPTTLLTSSRAFCPRKSIFCPLVNSRLSNMRCSKFLLLLSCCCFLQKHAFKRSPGTRCRVLLVVMSSLWTMLCKQEAQSMNVASLLYASRFTFCNSSSLKCQPGSMAAVIHCQTVFSLLLILRSSTIHQHCTGNRHSYVQHIPICTAPQCMLLSLVSEKYNMSLRPQDVL